jgi:hypothetical protein
MGLLILRQLLSPFQVDELQVQKHGGRHSESMGQWFSLAQFQAVAAQDGPHPRLR